MHGVARVEEQTPVASRTSLPQHCMDGLQLARLRVAQQRRRPGSIIHKSTDTIVSELLKLYDLISFIGVASVFDSVMKAGASTVLLAIDEVGPMGGGDMAYERSHYTFYKSDGSVFDHGKYVLCVCLSRWELLTANLVPLLSDKIPRQPVTKTL